MYRKGFINVVIIVLIVLFGVVGYVVTKEIHKPLLPQAQNQQTAIATKRQETFQGKIKTESFHIENWIKPKSSSQGYPIVFGKPDSVLFPELHIYNVRAKSLTLVDKSIAWGGGFFGTGTLDPTVSPDLLYTIFFDSKGNFYLLSNETREKRLIVNVENGDLALVSGWSPDSKKIIFYVEEKPGIGFLPRAHASDFVVLKKFYLFDIDSGILTKLDFQPPFISFIDASHVLVGSSSDVSRLINLQSFQFENITIKNLTDLQVNFSNDGKWWSFAHSKGDNSSIYYAQFPNTDGVLIDSGAYADVQWPTFSPDNTKIAYEKAEGEVGEKSGIPKTRIWIYDVSNKTKKSYVLGKPERWIDEKRLIVSGIGGVDKNLYILHIDSGQIEQMTL